MDLLQRLIIDKARCIFRNVQLGSLELFTKFPVGKDSEVRFCAPSRKSSRRIEKKAGAQRAKSKRLTYMTSVLLGNDHRATASFRSLSAKERRTREGECSSRDQACTQPIAPVSSIFQGLPPKNLCFITDIQRRRWEPSTKTKGLIGPTRQVTKILRLLQTGLNYDHVSIGISCCFLHLVLGVRYLQPFYIGVINME